MFGQSASAPGGRAVNGSSGQKSSLLRDSQASTLKTNPHLSSSNCTAGPALHLMS